ncbi:MAG: 30S ribosomal protein S4e [Candidatus Lokiarchaeota archaeon]|nr:30S ribosomal protein S4e [Candidatus Harpocratesius repetitus]
MGSKGNKRYLKRLASPGYLQIQRKNRKAGKFFLKARPGPHPFNFSLPLGHIFRDLLKVSNNIKETKFILNKGQVFIDGKPQNDIRFPVGLMDVVELHEINKAYRVLPSRNHGLILSEITKEEAKFKLCKILKITTLRGGHLQLNLHDGRNIRILIDNPKEKPSIPYKTGGTLKISLPDQKILDYFPLEEGNQAMIYQGKNIGVSGQVKELIKRFGVNASLAIISTEHGELSTSYDYVFIIGNDKPAIDLPLEV